MGLNIIGGIRSLQLSWNYDDVLKGLFGEFLGYIFLHSLIVQDCERNRCYFFSTFSGSSDIHIIRYF